LANKAVQLIADKAAPADLRVVCPTKTDVRTRTMAEKHILSVEFDFPGGLAEYVAFSSKQSLSDADLVVFKPSIADMYGYGVETYNGKPAYPRIVLLVSSRPQRIGGVKSLTPYPPERPSSCSFAR
jgi:hypothetical protein